MMEPNSSRVERALNTPYDISFSEGEKRTSTGRRGDQYWSRIVTRTGHIEAVLVGAVTSTGRFFAFVKP